jgi:hypothetical protein
MPARRVQKRPVQQALGRILQARKADRRVHWPLRTWVLTPMYKRAMPVAARQGRSHLWQLARPPCDAPELRVLLQPK